MTRFSVVLIETVAMRYPAEEIEAEDEAAARKIAEEMRVQGQLGHNPSQEVVSIVCEIREVSA